MSLFHSSSAATSSAVGSSGNLSMHSKQRKCSLPSESNSKVIPPVASCSRVQMLAIPPAILTCSPHPSQVSVAIADFDTPATKPCRRIRATHTSSSGSCLSAIREASAVYRSRTSGSSTGSRRFGATSRAAVVGSISTRLVRFFRRHRAPSGVANVSIILCSSRAYVRSTIHTRTDSFSASLTVCSWPICDCSRSEVLVSVPNLSGWDSWPDNSRPLALLLMLLCHIHLRDNS